MTHRFVPARNYDCPDLRSTLRILGGWWSQVSDGTAELAHSPLNDLVQAQHALLDAHPSAPADGPLPQRGEELFVALTHRASAQPTDADTALLDGSLALIASAADRIRPTRIRRGATSGTVAHLAASSGGVPKRGVDNATVGVRGVVGDVQRARQHHGRPWQALCLWSTEVISALIDEGHPIFPGAAGENITVSGFDWRDLRSGDQLRIGADVIVEISVYAIPCSKNHQWFSTGDSSRIHHDTEEGVSRLYASVLTEGTVHLGDEVVLLG